MTITRNFKLCLNAGTQNAPYINVNQYDEGEQWIFDLYTEGGQKFTPSTGAIIGIKSDGNAILNSGTVNSDGQVVITETQQMTAASGLAVFELLIEGETHGTANFIVNVERRPSDDAEFSDSDLSMLQEAIDAAEVINEILDEGGDPSEIITENVNAWLDNHPEATTTVQDGAITAPKINSTLWDKLLVSEEASGAVASFDDGADDVPVSSLKVALEPIQTGSGDPSPTNIRPIIASNGKNVSTTSSATTTASGYLNESSGKFGGCLANKTYTISFDVLETNIYAVRLRYKNGSNLTTWSAGSLDAGGRYSYTYTPTEDGYFNFNTGGVAFTGSTKVFDNVMVEENTVATPYQPYQSIMVERCGKNLCRSTFLSGTSAGVAYTHNADGSITCVGTPSSTSATHSISGGVMRFANGTYILTGSASVIRVRVNLYDANLNVVSRIADNGSGATFTVDDTIPYISVLCYASSLTEVNETIYPMIRQSYITDAEYVPYEVTSYPYSLGQSVYGGTVDLATGVLTVDRVMHQLTGSESFTLSGATSSNPRRFMKALSAMNWEPAVDNQDGISDRLVYKRIPSATDAFGTFRIGQYLTIPDSESVFATANDFNAYLLAQYNNNMPVEICYPLATPTTVQLTPQEVKTLLGYNNISSTGTVDVIYHADTKLYIDKKIGELS